MSNIDLPAVIRSIHTTIKDFSSGSIGMEEAKKLYNEYLKKIDKSSYEGKADTPNGLTHSTRNLCYMHNVDNFSLLSTVYVLTANSIEVVYTYGNSSLQNTLNDYIENNKTEISFAATTEMKLLDSTDKKIDGHSLYLIPVAINSRFIILFASASSSSYFSVNVFLQFAEYNRKFLSLLLDNNQPILFDFSYRLSHYIRKKLLELVKKEEITVQLFLFSTLHKTFDHMGVHSIIEISRTIKKKIEEHFKSQCQPISLNEYLVILPAQESDLTQQRHIIDFVYNNINIPYKLHTVTLHNEEDVYTFWSRIYSDQSLLHTKSL
ncbi:MAG: hypothetical protein ACOCX9_05915 [Spirochaetota bacterium]